MPDTRLQRTRDAYEDEDQICNKPWALFDEGLQVYEDFGRDYAAWADKLMKQWAMRVHEGMERVSAAADDI